MPWQPIGSSQVLIPEKNGINKLEEVRAKFARDRNYSLDLVWTSVSAASMQKKVDCMTVSSDIKLCTCLADELPVSLSYLNYVHIVTNPKGSDFSHLQLNPHELSKATGMVWSARDMCIAGDRQSKTPTRWIKN